MSVVAEVRFHPQNTFVTPPGIDVALDGATGELTRIDLRNEPRYVTFGGTVGSRAPLSGVIGEAVFDASVVGQGFPARPSSGCTATSWRRWRSISVGSTDRERSYDAAGVLTVLVEPVDRPLPRQIGSCLVVALRRRVVEAVNGARIDVALVRHTGGSQRLVRGRGPGLGEAGVELAVVHEDGRFDLERVLGRRRGPIERGRCRRSAPSRTASVLHTPPP